MPDGKAEVVRRLSVRRSLTYKCWTTITVRPLRAAMINSRCATGTSRPSAICITNGWNGRASYMSR